MSSKNVIATYVAVYFDMGVSIIDALFNYYLANLLLNLQEVERCFEGGPC